MMSILFASTYGTPADKHEYIAYEYNGVTYLPHYRNRNIFVGPGYPFQNTTRYTDVELQLRGAKPKLIQLWQRGQHVTVDHMNP